MRGYNIIWFSELPSPWQLDAHPYDITAYSVKLAGTECDLRAHSVWAPAVYKTLRRIIFSTIWGGGGGGGEQFIETLNKIFVQIQKRFAYVF